MPDLRLRRAPAWAMGELDPQTTTLPTTIVGPAPELEQPGAATVVAELAS